MVYGEMGNGGLCMTNVEVPMAAAVICGPCMYREVTREAKQWCTNCDEGICEDCAKVHRSSEISQSHELILVDDFRKIENVSSSDEVCKHHGKKFVWFCKSHDEILCAVCFRSNHHVCSGVISITDASKNARHSTALSDLEDAIKGTLLNVKQCIENRQSATNEIGKQELEIKNIIILTRKQVNDHLDKLQEQLLRELRSTSNRCTSKYNKLLQNLESTEEMLTQLRKQTLHMKTNCSEKQLFLGTRQINKKIAQEIECTKNFISTTKEYELQLNLHSLIENILDGVKEFGQIKVLECDTNLDFRDPKIHHAQIGINVHTSRNISDYKVQLIKEFDLNCHDIEYEVKIMGSAILPNGHLLIANYTERNYLTECSSTGEHIRNIPVSGLPCDIELLDLNSIVVTYGEMGYLEIMNNVTFEVETKIDLQDHCIGVSHKDGKLYIVCGYHIFTIKVLDISSRKLEIWKTLSLSLLDYFDIATSKDKVFYTVMSENIIHCCHMNGEEIWQFESESITSLCSIAVDDEDNVFVVGNSSNNLTIIQHDGKDSKILLSESDGLYEPRTVYYDKKTKTILICRQYDWHIWLYKVV